MREYFDIIHKKLEILFYNNELIKVYDEFHFYEESLFEEIHKITGIPINESIFTWQSEALAEMGCLYSATIGLKEVEITKYDTVADLIYKLAYTIAEQIYVYLHELNVESTIPNSFETGFLHRYQNSELEACQISDIISIINSNRTCDETFEKMLSSYGYKIGIDENEMRYIDAEMYREGSKVYLDVLENPNTLYRKKKCRPKIEVLYILQCLRWNECIFSEDGNY